MSFVVGEQAAFDVQTNSRWHQCWYWDNSRRASQAPGQSLVLEIWPSNLGELLSLALRAPRNLSPLRQPRQISLNGSGLIAV